LLTRCFKLVVLLFFWVVLSGCEGQQPATVIVPDRTILLEGVTLKISPGQIPVETLLKLQLQSEQPLKKISAELTGVSMYMGRIPLRFTQDSTTGLWQTDFMLGACADPKMTWRLTLTLTDVAGQTRQLVTEFQSSWRE